MNNYHHDAKSLEIKSKYGKKQLLHELKAVWINSSLMPPLLLVLESALNIFIFVLTKKEKQKALMK